MRILRAAGWALVALFALLALGSLDWRPARPALAPVIEQALRGRGALQAGAARVAMMPGWPVPLGGFARAARQRTEKAHDTLYARAVALRAGAVTVAVVSLEVVYVPEELARAVAGRAGKDVQVVVTATHTHAGPGGLDRSLPPQHLGAGAFDERTLALVADRAVAAVQTAVESLQPASLVVRELDGEGLSRGRGGKDDVAPRSWVLGLLGENGTVATLVVHSAHPTVLGPANEALSGDWPGATMAALERAPGGVALVLQGAGGDRTHTAPAQDDRALAARAFGERVAGRAREALAREGPGASELDLGFGRARFSLPRPEAHAAPRVLRRLATNVLSLFAPATAPAAALVLGGVTFLAAPGEPVAAVGQSWEETSEITFGLAGAYIGYLETPAEVGAGTGEAERQYFAPELAERAGEGLRAAAAAARGAVVH